MFSPEEQTEAEEKGHMTIDEAARIAGRAGARRAVLVHISPRYGEEDMGGLNAAASNRFSEAEMGRDLQVYPIPYREE